MQHQLWGAQRLIQEPGPLLAPVPSRLASLCRTLPLRYIPQHNHSPSRFHLKMLSILPSSFLGAGVSYNHLLLLCTSFVFLTAVVYLFRWFPSKFCQHFSFFQEFGTFFYASFLKPHAGDGVGTGQQAALESFYKAQVYRFECYRAMEPNPFIGRPTLTMLRGKYCFGEERICSL